MSIEFYCPYLKRLITSEKCCSLDETPLCDRCTSEMDTARQALYDWLKAAYAARYPITMKPDGIEIVVHDRMRIIADPCDETGDTYLGADCGDAGSTHCHPYDDMKQHIADLLEGRMTVVLADRGWRGWMVQQAWFRESPEDLHGWEYLVDMEGMYTPEEYAGKLRIMLPSRKPDLE